MAFSALGYNHTGLAALFHPLNVLLHPVGTLPLHLVGNMTVYIQRKCRRSVAEVALHRLNIIPGSDGSNSERMPLWHNKDKSENPCIASEYPQRDTM